VIHYYWLVKSDVRKPVAYGAIVAVLLLWRAWEWYRKKPRPVPAHTARISARAS
jgi:sulfoxide reductase heme-binding subunit YedZ